MVAEATTLPNEEGWYRDPVTVHFTCADAVSGVKTCPADRTLSSDGANQSVSGTAEDRAGNMGTGSLTGINIDRTAPTLSGTPDRAANAAGWYKDPVIVSWNCADALSGLASCSTATTVAEAQGANVDGKATDKAGNEKQATVGPFRVDRTDPSATISSGPVIPAGAKVQGAASDADPSPPQAVSGVASVKVTYTNNLAVGAPIVRTYTCSGAETCNWSVDPPPFGVWTVRAEATDQAGRATPASAQPTTTISVNP